MSERCEKCNDCRTLQARVKSYVDDWEPPTDLLAEFERMTMERLVTDREAYRDTLQTRHPCIPTDPPVVVDDAGTRFSLLEMD